MSGEASEIVTSLTTMLRQSLVELHNQTINDVQGIVARSELRLLERIAELETQLADVRSQLGERQP